MRSETGWVSGRQGVGTVAGKVKIDRPAAPGIRPLQIITSDLRVQPKTTMPETDADAHAKSRDDWVESTGMQIWFAQPIRVKNLPKLEDDMKSNRPQIGYWTRQLTCILC